MYFILDSCNVNQVEVLEPSLQSNAGDGKMGVPAGSKVYDIGQILPSQNASHLLIIRNI